MSNNVLDSIVHAIAYDPDHILNCPHDLSHNFKSETEFIDDQQQELTNALDEASKLDLKELLIKPSDATSVAKPVLPADLNLTKSSELSSIFKKSDVVNRAEKNHAKKNLKSLIKLQERIETIKKSMKNPFEMFLPNEFRSQSNTANTDNAEITKWNLIKTEVVKATPFVLQKKQAFANEEEDENVAKPANTNMIPLKQQFKQEKYKHQVKNKILKNVDFTDAIIEYNKSKVEKVHALGSKDLEDEEIQSVDIDTQQQQLNDLIASRISSNLKSLSEAVKSGINEGEAASSAAFSYDAKSMNELFAKPAPKKGEYDPSSKIKRVQFSKVNKRRSTNAVTRNKQNQSMTFKKEDK